jgi:hypothetical protein
VKSVVQKVNTQMKAEGKKNRKRSFAGSALILAVVLTSLLAIIGVMFLMVARVDRTATSGISENRELNFAVETVVALVSQELVLDVPGMPKGQEYYDYPGPEDKWLASLEPYRFAANDYRWRQISNITGMGGSWGDLQAEIIVDYQQNIAGGVKADADGDGVADSNWVELEGINSNKGKPIYAAIRVIDNGGMLNVNTACKFNPNAPGVTAADIDGSSQMQINLAALSQRGNNGSLGKAANDLQDERCGSEPNDLSLYEENVVWRYNEPNGRYTPFDLSDELELRNRFTLNRNDIDTRIEEVWDSAFQDHYLSTPVTGSLSDWREEVYYDLSEPNATKNYSYRHIGTIYNMDRIIRPDGEKMLNINDANVSSVYNEIVDANLNIANAKAVAAQIAVNLIDFRDNDSNVTTLDVNGITYYGFERPCVYISELAHAFKEVFPIGGPVGAPSTIYRSYAIELHKPYPEDSYPKPEQWRLSIEGYADSPIPIDWSGTKHFHVIYLEDPCVPLTVNFDTDDIDPNLADSEVVQELPFVPYIEVFKAGDLIELQRRVDDVNDTWITVDSELVPADDNVSGWLVPDLNGIPHSIQRNITLHKCIRRLWASASEASSPTLGRDNDNYPDGGPELIQAHPYLSPLIYPEGGFRNIGEIGMLFRKDVYDDATVRGAIESDVRLNLADPNFQHLFKYLTVFDPTEDKIDNDGDGSTDECGIPPVAGDELKIPGRVNINTAPWYVLAQLPWVTNPTLAPDDPDRYKLAQAIVEHRDDPLVEGFRNIGELMNVNEMGYYKTVESGDLTDFPDLTASDGAGDDFEERDVIFARISNLVTVRSDIFTAYILVRIGTDGPQKRAIAILDRSNVYSGDDKVRIIALHLVPDPR